MAIKLTADSFVKVVQQSGLIEREPLDRFLRELKGQQADVTSSATIAEELVANNMLTEWQADKLLQGKHKGFFLGKYRLLALLGKGGMGSVYLAEHVLMRRRCAIKVLPTNQVEDSSHLGRFHREAQAVASLDHPNIVRAYDVDREEVEQGREVHFLVMEHVEGQGLQDLVLTQGPLSYVNAADFVRQAALGLHHAHQAGLVHRDVKPANLLIDPNGTVKILDLGLAQFFNQSEENPLTLEYDEKVLGTVDFLAPEQAMDSHKVDVRVDIYSLGCTAFFTLTGHPPFPEGTLAQRVMAHQRKKPSAIEDERPDVPPALSAIVQKMLAKNPEDRYQTADEVAQELGVWLVQNGDEDWKKRNSAVSGVLLGEDSGLAPAAAVPVAAAPVAAAPVAAAPVAATDDTSDNVQVSPTEAVPAAEAPRPPQAASPDVGLDAFLSNLDGGGGGLAPPSPPMAEPPSIAPVVTQAADVPPADAASFAPPITEPAEPPFVPPDEPVFAAPVEPLVTGPAEPPGAASVEPVFAAPVEPTFVPPDEPLFAASAESPMAGPAEPPGAASVEPVFAGPVEPTFVPPDEPLFAATVESPKAEPIEPPVVASAEPVFAAPVEPPVAGIPVASPTDAVPVAVPVDAGPVFPTGPADGFAGLPTGAPAAPIQTAQPAPRGEASKRTSRGMSGGKLAAIIAVVAVLVGGIGYGVVAFLGSDSPKDKVAKKSKGKSSKEPKKKGTSPSPIALPAGSAKKLIHVGANGDFKTIGEALQYVKAHNGEYRDLDYSQRFRVQIKVDGGKTYKDRIVIDNSDESSYPKGLQLLVEGDQKAVLAPSGPTPAIQLKGLERCIVDGFAVKAESCKVAIDLSGRMTKTKIRNVEVSGFLGVGIRGAGVAGAPAAELVLENITLRGGGPESVGMKFVEGKESTTRFHILGGRFFGPMASGIVVETNASHIQVRESIFSGIGDGLLFGGGNKEWKHILIGNNSFHGLDRGIVFGELPSEASAEIGFYQNLFTKVKGPELVIEKNYLQEKFDKILSTDGAAIENNWSDRPAPEKPVTGERDLMIPPGKRSTDLKLVSTDPNAGDFLTPAPGSPLLHPELRRGHQRRELKRYVGAAGP